MTTEAIIEALVGAGCTVRFLSDGKATLIGSVPDGVVEHIRADREAFLEAWREYQSNRYLRCPPQTLPLRREPPKWRPEVYRRVESYVRRQSDDVVQWGFMRGNQYREERPDWSVEQCCKAALSDVLHWQLERHTDPIELLRTLDEVVATT